MNYPKNQVQSVPIAALCPYNIQRENLVFKNSLCILNVNVCIYFYFGVGVA